MKVDSEGAVLVGSPHSQERIIHAIRGLNKMFWAELPLSYAYGYLESCEFEADDPIRGNLIAVSEYRSKL